MAKIDIEDTELAALMDRLEKAKSDLIIKDDELFTMYRCTAKILNVIGLSDGVIIDPKMFEGKVFPKIIKGGGSLIALMTEANVMEKFGGGNKAKAEIEEKFSFLNDWLPILEKYNLDFQRKGIEMQKLKEVKA